MIDSVPGLKGWTASTLAGRNWLLITQCDYKYGNKVQEVIGG